MYTATHGCKSGPTMPLFTGPAQRGSFDQRCGDASPLQGVRHAGVGHAHDVTVWLVIGFALQAVDMVSKRPMSGR